MVAAGAAGAAPSGTAEPPGERTAVRDTVERRAAEIEALPSRGGIHSIVFRRGDASSRAGSGAVRERPIFLDGRTGGADEEGEPSHPLLLAAAGVVGGAAGLLAGGALGADLTCAGAEPVDDLCFLPGAFLGGTVGMSLGVPTGVHLANGRRGDWLLGTAASLTVWGAGVGLMAAMGFEGPGALATFAAVPLGQLVAATAIERDTSTTEEDP